MAIYTPRGLKIRLGTEYAFALMARLCPRLDAFRVLQLTEEVENLSSLATFISCIIAFAARLNPIMIGVIIGTVFFIFEMAHLLGIFVPPFNLLLPISRVYSWFAGYGIFFLFLFIFGYFYVGWLGVIAFVVARIAAGCLVELIDLIYGRFLFKKTGFVFSKSERSFFHAYRLSADQVGVTRSLEVSEDEMESEKWKAPYIDLMLKWPVVVSRFTKD